MTEATERKRTRGLTISATANATSGRMIHSEGCLALEGLALPACLRQRDKLFFLTSNLLSTPHLRVWIFFFYINLWFWILPKINGDRHLLHGILNTKILFSSVKITKCPLLFCCVNVPRSFFFFFCLFLANAPKF